MPAVRHLLLIAFATAVFGAPATAEPSFSSDQNGRVTSVAGLYSDKDCLPMQVQGRVVRREFQANELRMKGLVLESDDGSRSYVNVEVPWDDLDMLRLNGITRGLQTLLKEGRQVKLRVRACGAAGRVMMLDAVR